MHIPIHKSGWRIFVRGDWRYSNRLHPIPVSSTSTIQIRMWCPGNKYFKRLRRPMKLWQIHNTGHITKPMDYHRWNRTHQQRPISPNTNIPLMSLWLKRAPLPAPDRLDVLIRRKMTTTTKITQIQLDSTMTILLLSKLWMRMKMMLIVW